MVVYENDPACIRKDRRLVDLSWCDKRCLHRPLANKLYAAHSMLSVKVDCIEVLTVAYSER